MPRPHPRSSRSAFTLVEAIIAVVILSVAVPPMLWALGESHAARVSPIRSSTARWLAMEKLEDVIADRHSTARGYSALIAANYPPEASVEGFPAFARHVTIAETGADLSEPGTGYKRVTVTVTWTDGAGVTHALDLATVVTEYTP